jgi:hypothetical protein
MKFLECIFIFVLFICSLKDIHSSEVAPKGEKKSIEGLKKIFLQRQKNLWVSQNKKAHRGAHAFGHGCVKASFKVLPNIPKELKVGLFSSPKTYKAWVRYSNGSSIAKKDQEADSRGMAIKVMGVPGKKLLKGKENAETQDFLTVTHPVFPVKNAVEFNELMNVVMEHGKPLWYFIPSLYKPWTWRFTQLNIARAAVAHKITHLFDVKYFSMVPYKLGKNHQVKYSNRPCTGHKSSYNEIDQERPFYRKRMKDHLSKKSACFDFMVQVRKKGMLIEDATQLWNESESAFVSVAKVEISKQSFDTAKQNEYCENLSFNPWHALPDHEPLGSLNRARKVIYQTISKFRHDHNKAKREEPTDYISF